MQLRDFARHTRLADIRDELGERLLLGSIRRLDCAGDNEFGVEVGRDVPLVAVEPLALAAVPHVLVFDRDAAFRRHTMSNPTASARGIWLQVLIANLTKRCQVLGERWSRGVARKILGDPLLEGVDLFHEFGHRGRLLLRVTPFAVQGGLDAAFAEQRSPRDARDFVLRPVEDPRDARDYSARGVGEKVDGVLDAAGALQGARVDGQPQRLGKLLVVESLHGAGDFHGAFEETSVEIVRDQATAKCAERALREGRLGGGSATCREMD